MAGSFAKDVCARRLVLTHFSQRYRGLSELEKEGTVSIAKLVDEAKLSFNQENVVAAEDLFQLQIPLPR